MLNDDHIDRIRKLELKAGDCIVINSTKAIGSEQREAIGRGVRHAIDSLGLERVPVLILDEHLEISVLRTSDLGGSNAAQ